MEYYITLTIKKMETKYKCITGWVSLFNITAALCDNNIKGYLNFITCCKISIYAGKPDKIRV